MQLQPFLYWYETSRRRLFQRCVTCCLQEFNRVGSPRESVVGALGRPVGAAFLEEDGEVEGLVSNSGEPL
jgi:hypothetical protein